MTEPTQFLQCSRRDRNILYLHNHGRRPCIAENTCLSCNAFWVKYLDVNMCFMTILDCTIVREFVLLVSWYRIYVKLFDICTVHNNHKVLVYIQVIYSENFIITENFIFCSTGSGQTLFRPGQTLFRPGHMFTFEILSQDLRHNANIMVVFPYTNTRENVQSKLYLFRMSAHPYLFHIPLFISVLVIPLSIRLQFRKKQNNSSPLEYSSSKIVY
jgi:hypothetical protein